MSVPISRGDKPFQVAAMVPALGCVWRGEGKGPLYISGELGRDFQVQKMSRGLLTGISFLTPSSFGGASGQETASVAVKMFNLGRPG